MIDIAKDCMVDEEEWEMALNLFRVQYLERNPIPRAAGGVDPGMTLDLSCPFLIFCITLFRIRDQNVVRAGFLKCRTLEWLNSKRDKAAQYWAASVRRSTREV